MGFYLWAPLKVSLLAGFSLRVAETKNPDSSRSGYLRIRTPDVEKSIRARLVELDSLERLKFGKVIDKSEAEAFSDLGVKQIRYNQIASF